LRIWKHRTRATAQEGIVADDLKILLVSPDLLSTSRLAALARPLPARMETLRSLDDEPRDGPFDLVLLDLQSLPGDAAVIVARALKLVERQVEGTGRAAKLVAFGPHVHKERLADAVSAGADAAVSRGELLGSFPGLVKRWLGEDPTGGDGARIRGG
jgi:hypothetical protein